MTILLENIIETTTCAKPRTIFTKQPDHKFTRGFQLQTTSSNTKKPTKWTGSQKQNMDFTKMSEMNKEDQCRCVRPFIAFSRQCRRSMKKTMNRERTIDDTVPVTMT